MAASVLLTKVHGPDASPSTNVECMLRLGERGEEERVVRQVEHVMLQVYVSQHSIRQEDLMTIYPGDLLPSIQKTSQYCL